MQVAAEINLDTRTVLEYMLSPVQKSFHEAARALTRVRQSKLRPRARQGIRWQRRIDLAHRQNAGLCVRLERRFSTVFTLRLRNSATYLVDFAECGQFACFALTLHQRITVASRAGKRTNSS
jgi:hypothetical protein